MGFMTNCTQFYQQQLNNMEKRMMQEQMVVIASVKSTIADLEVEVQRLLIDQTVKHCELGNAVLHDASHVVLRSCNAIKAMMETVAVHTPVMRRKKNTWTQEEEDAFCEAFEALNFEVLDKRPWAILLNKIEADHPGVLKERTPINLKDKARCMGLPSPVTPNVPTPRQPHYTGSVSRSPLSRTTPLSLFLPPRPPSPPPSPPSSPPPSPPCPLQENEAIDHAPSVACIDPPALTDDASFAVSDVTILLDSDMATECFTHLRNPLDLLRSASVCKAWCNLHRDPRFWFQLLQRRWPLALMLPGVGDTSYRSLVLHHGCRTGEYAMASTHPERQWVDNDTYLVIDARSVCKDLENVHGINVERRIAKVLPFSNSISSTKQMTPSYAWEWESELSMLWEPTLLGIQQAPERMKNHGEEEFDSGVDVICVALWCPSLGSLTFLHGPGDFDDKGRNHGWMECHSSRANDGSLADFHTVSLDYGIDLTRGNLPLEKYVESLPWDEEGFVGGRGLLHWELSFLSLGRGRVNFELCPSFRRYTPLRRTEACEIIGLLHWYAIASSLLSPPLSLSHSPLSLPVPPGFQEPTAREMDTTLDASITSLDSECLLIIATRAPALMLACHRFYNIISSIPLSASYHCKFIDISLNGSMLEVCNFDRSTGTFHGRTLVYARHCPEPMTRIVGCDDMDGLGLGYYRGWIFDQKLWPRKMEVSHGTLKKLLLELIGDAPIPSRDVATTEIAFSWKLSHTTMSIHFEDGDRLWLDDDDLSDMYGGGDSVVDISRIAACKLLEDLLFRRPAIQAPVCDLMGKHHVLNCNGFCGKIQILRILDDNARESHCIGEFHWCPMGR
jgi:hypothetical protein